MQRSAPQTPLIDNNNQTNQRSVMLTSNEAISTSTSPVCNKSFFSSGSRSESPNDIKLNKLSSGFSKTAHRSISMNNFNASGSGNSSASHLTEVIPDNAR